MKIDINNFATITRWISQYFWEFIDLIDIYFPFNFKEKEKLWVKWWVSTQNKDDLSITYIPDIP